MKTVITRLIEGSLALSLLCFTGQAFAEQTLVATVAMPKRTDHIQSQYFVDFQKSEAFVLISAIERRRLFTGSGHSMGREFPIYSDVVIYQERVQIQGLGFDEKLGQISYTDSTGRTDVCANLELRNGLFRKHWRINPTADCLSSVQLHRNESRQLVADVYFNLK